MPGNILFRKEVFSSLEIDGLDCATKKLIVLLMLDIQRMMKLLKPVALWIKSYQHTLRAIAGLLFCLSLIFGVFWIFGKEVEPVTFVLSAVRADRWLAMLNF